MEDAFLISIAVASASTIIADATIFGRFRRWVKSWSDFFGKLVCCGWCLSIWVSFAVVALYEITLYWSDYFFLDYFLTSLAVSWMASFQWIIFSVLLKISGK